MAAPAHSVATEPLAMAARAYSVATEALEMVARACSVATVVLEIGVFAPAGALKKTCIYRTGAPWVLAVAA